MIVQVEVEIPDDAMALASVGVVQYVDADGEMQRAVGWTGDTMTQLVGMLELAKLRLFEISRRGDG